MAWRLVQYNNAYSRLMAECDQALQDAIKPRLAQLQMLGNLADYPITEAFGDGLFEVRARYKRTRIRFLFGFLPGKQIVIVWGGKKDQRTLPQATINAARRLLKDAERAEALDGIKLN